MKTVFAVVWWFVVAIVVSAPALAGDLYLDVNGYSWHGKDTYEYQGKRHEYNSNNAGLGVTYGLIKYVEVFAGFYDNSYRRNSIYGGVKIKKDFMFGEITITPGINVGVSTGYEDTQVQADRYQVVAMPAVRILYRGVGLTIGYIPAIEKEEPGYVSVSTITAQINILVAGP